MTEAVEVRPSPELKAVTERFLDAIVAGDVHTVRTQMDTSAHSMVLGSDPKEWWKGPEVADLMTLSAEHRRDYRYDTKRLEAFEAGKVGWAAVDTVAEFAPADTDQPDTPVETVPLRITAVFLLIDGAWKITQWHVSVPEPDDPDVVGLELSEAVDEMLKALDSEAEVAELTNELQTNTVTLVFTDIVDSTVRAGQAGDEAWSAIVTGHLAEIDRTATRNDGVVVKTTGDGAMLAFGSARKAVLAALEVRRAAEDTDEGAPLRLRIGIHTGEAVKTDVDYFGQTVNEAARIMAVAEPDQILVSDLVRGLVGEMPGVEFGGALNVTLKGIEGIRRVHPVL